MLLHPIRHQLRDVQARASKLRESLCGDDGIVTLKAPKIDGATPPSEKTCGDSSVMYIKVEFDVDVKD